MTSSLSLSLSLCLCSLRIFNGYCHELSEFVWLYRSVKPLSSVIDHYLKTAFECSVSLKAGGYPLVLTLRNKKWFLQIRLKLKSVFLRQKRPYLGTDSMVNVLEPAQDLREVGFMLSVLGGRNWDFRCFNERHFLGGIITKAGAEYDTKTILWGKLGQER